MEYWSIKNLDDLLNIRENDGSQPGVLDITYNSDEFKKDEGELDPNESAYIAGGLIETLKAFSDKYGLAALEVELHDAPHVLALLERTEQMEEVEKILVA